MDSQKESHGNLILSLVKNRCSIIKVRFTEGYQELWINLLTILFYLPLSFY